MQSLKAKLDKAIEDEKATATDKIVSLESKLSEYDGYISLDDTRRAEVQGELAAVKQKINNLTLIAMIRDAANNFETYQYDELLQRIEDWNTPNQPIVTPPNGATAGGNTEDPTIVPGKTYLPKSAIVSARELQVSFSKLLLESEADVDDYLKTYKITLVDAVKEGKKVRV